MITALDIIKGTSLVSQGSEAVPPASTPVFSTHNSPVERFRSVASSMQRTAKSSINQEIERIIALPIIPDPTEEEIDLVSKYYWPDGTLRLFKEQVKAMMQYHEYGGLIAPIAVGDGKTLISVLIANDAYCDFGVRKIILMNPPNLIGQLRGTELPFYRRHVSINVPFYWIDGSSSKEQRMKRAKSKRTGCYVISYSLLSGQQGAELIDAIEPDLIIGDEVQSIASSNSSARGRRFRAAIKKFKPQLVGLSGTFTKKTPKDYHHLVVHALHENSFMPIPNSIADEWAVVLDSNASSIEEMGVNSVPQFFPINPLITWAKQNFPKTKWPNNLIGFRSVFQKRLRTAPGISASGGEKLGVSLRIINVKISEEEKQKSKGWEQLQKLVKQLINSYIAPNGDDIDHAMHVWRWRYELEGFGFYNNLFWPTVEKLSLRKKISISDAQVILDKSKKYFVLHQEYWRVLRRWITQRAKKGLDTPFLIAGDMHRNGNKHVGNELYSSWAASKNALFEGRIERDSEVVRVCDFRINKIIEWATKWHKKYPNKGAIIWYQNKGVAEWLKERFIAADLPVIYCPAGKKGLANIEDRTQGDKFAIASVKAYHRGLNLQYHHDTEFFAQWPREAHIAQQAIGRVHRNGQPTDQVKIFRSDCSDFDRILFAACINDAAYVHQTTQKQKLLYADYDERPVILPYSVLLEWGTQPELLDSRGQKLLEDKFKGE